MLHAGKQINTRKYFQEFAKVCKEKLAQTCLHAQTCGIISIIFTVAANHVAASGGVV